MKPSNHPRRLARARAYAAVWLMLFVGLLASAGAAKWFWDEGEAQDKARFENAVTNLIERLDTRTERYAEQLERFAQWIEEKADLTKSAWNQNLKRLAPSGELPAFIEVCYMTNSALLSMADIEREIPNMERDEDGKLKPNRVRKPPRLSVAFHWENFQPATHAKLKEWMNTPAIAAEWWETRKGRMISSPRRLIISTDGESIATVSLFIPVFTTDYLEMQERFTERILNGNRFQGLVVGTIDWRRLTSDLVGGNGQISCEAFATAQDASEVSRDSAMTGSASPDPASVFRARFRTAHSWPFYRKKWTLLFYSTPAFEHQSTRYRAWLALGGGSVLSLLMFGLLATQIRARRAQEGISGDLRLALAELNKSRKEREQLNHDLHDGAIQSLYALQLGLSRTVTLANGNSEGLGSRLEEHRRSLVAVIGELRGFILKHEAEAGPSGDLAGVLTALVERLRLSTDKTLVAEVSPAAAAQLSGEQAVHLANLAREALSNALRHANASAVTVRLNGDSQQVEMSVTDNGLGFNPEEQAKKGVGLKSMTSRAVQAGGTFQIDSAPGQGTVIRVRVPATNGDEK